MDCLVISEELNYEKRTPRFEALSRMSARRLAKWAPQHICPRQADKFRLALAVSVIPRATRVGTASKSVIQGG